MSIRRLKPLKYSHMNIFHNCELHYKSASCVSTLVKTRLNLKASLAFSWPMFCSTQHRVLRKCVYIHRKQCGPTFLHYRMISFETICNSKLIIWFWLNGLRSQSVSNTKWPVICHLFVDIFQMEHMEATNTCPPLLPLTHPYSQPPTPLNPFPSPHFPQCMWVCSRNELMTYGNIFGIEKIFLTIFLLQVTYCWNDIATHWKWIHAH